MSGHQNAFARLLQKDARYKADAYQFVREALAYAQDELGMGQAEAAEAAEAAESVESASSARPDAHLTGQQLCEAIRLFALEQFGLMARVVLGNWGVRATSDFGEIVYNLIDIGMMKKSDSDRREDFDGVFDFEEAFERHFKITGPE